MVLRDWLDELEYELVQGSLDAEVEEVIYDSRRAAPGCVFVCIAGTRVDSHKFIPQVLEAGVRVIVAERDIEEELSAAGLSEEEEFYDMEDELTDRFGDIPREALELLRLARLKALAHKAYVTELTVKKDSIRIMMHPRADINVNAIPELIENERGKLRFIRGKDPKFIYTDTKPHSDCEAMLKKAEEIIKKLKKND